MAISVDIALTEKDYAHFRRKVLRRYYPLLYWLIIGGVTGALIGISTSILEQAFKDKMNPISYALAGCVVLYAGIQLCHSIIGQPLRKRFSKDSKYLLLPKRNTIDADGLHIACEVESTRIPWKGIDRIEETKDMLYFYLDNTAAHIIAKRCFANAEEAKRFKSEAMLHWNASRHAAAAQ